jgi:uncharacterized oligopeptide transporter (OPT) family protein
VAATVLFLGKAYTFGSPELPAPQATLMKTVIDGVLTGTLPWGLVGTGAAFSLCAILAGLPGLAFAVGIYLPLGSMTPIFLGGAVRRLVESRRKEGPKEGDPGVLAASGMIAGEGLVGVAIALLVAAKRSWPDAAWSRWLDAAHFAGKDFAWISGAAGVALGIVLVLGVAGVLWRAGESETSQFKAKP